MTQQDYLEQNLLGFENDTYAKDKFHEIITTNEIETVIETGTYLGATTKHLAQWTRTVHTIEIKKEHYDKAKNNLKSIGNIEMHYGNSAEILLNILSNLENKEKVFIFLDAHWQEYNPLLDELRSIKSAGLKPIIAIHDFKVEEHPELGYDTYNGQDYEWDWIKEGVEDIYGVDGYTVEYNSKATGAMRGIIFLQSK